MRDRRQFGLAMIMALISGLVVLGSVSLSLLESGYTLAGEGEGSTPIALFLGPQLLTLVSGGGAAEAQAAGESAGAGLVNSPTPTPACSYPPGWVPVAIRSEDTLRSLALAYNVSVEEIKKGNCYGADTLVLGITLYLPVPPAAAWPVGTSPAGMPTPVLPQVNLFQPPTQPPAACTRTPGWVAYFVRPGDTFANLGARLGYFGSTLMAGNCRTSAWLRVGELIYLPGYPPVLVYPTPPPWPSLPPPVATLPPPIATLPPPIATLPPPVETLPPPVETLPPPVETLPPPVETLPPPVETLPPPVVTLPPPVVTQPPPVETLPPPVVTQPPPVVTLPPPLPPPAATDPPLPPPAATQPPVP